MVVNFRAREISRGARKLARTPTIIKKKKKKNHENRSCDLFPPSRVRPSMCTPVTPGVPYLLLGLQDVQWAVGNSRGARKLARTPHVNQKKKKESCLVNSEGCNSIG